MPPSPFSVRQKQDPSGEDISQRTRLARAPARCHGNTTEAGWHTGSVAPFGPAGALRPGRSFFVRSIADLMEAIRPARAVEPLLLFDALGAPGSSYVRPRIAIVDSRELQPDSSWRRV